MQTKELVILHSYGGQLQHNLKNGLHRIMIGIIIIKMLCTAMNLMGYLPMSMFSWASAFTILYIFMCFFDPMPALLGITLLLYLGAYLVCYLVCLGRLVFKRYQHRITEILLGAICVSDIICFAISFWDLFDVIGFDLVQMSKLFGIVCNAAICMILWRPQKKYHPPF